MIGTYTTEVAHLAQAHELVPYPRLNAAVSAPGGVLMLPL